MQLWTEYEGRTIDGTYTLGKLLRSEGRNGFFATSDTTGTPAVIRLTEAHYDVDELLKRWRQVADMHDDNLISIARFGQTSFDGLAVTYAVMEANDANLGDVLRERPLTLAETQQVARAVHAGLTALHTSGLVHEHIAPDNVLAVGETVKLRSDCVRECIADIEFNTPEGCAELRRRDIHDFGILLLQCLTLEKTYNAGLNLPDVFRRLIPHMLDGSWTLEQIGQVVNASTPPAPTIATPNGTRPIATPQQVPPASARKPAQPQQQILPPQQQQAPPRPTSAEPALRPRRAIADEPAGFTLRPWLLIAGTAVIICIFIIWHFVAGRPAQPAQTTAAGETSPAVSTAASEPGTRPVPRPAADPAVRDATASSPLTAHAPGWYVIAYTYNHHGQAQTKADRLNDRHPGFHAEVFTPRGAGPFLVSLGGPMSQSEAKSLQQRARRSGFPGDTYIRNYR